MSNIAARTGGVQLNSQYNLREGEKTSLIKTKLVGVIVVALAKILK